MYQQSAALLFAGCLLAPLLLAQEQPPKLERTLTVHEMLASLDAQIKGDPKNATLYALRAEEHLRLFKSEDALRDLNHAIKLDPENPKYYFRRSLAWGDNDSRRAADTQTAIRKLNDPDQASANFFNLPKLIEAENESLIALLDQRIRQKPKDAVAYYERSQVRQFLQRQPGIGSALEDINHAVNLEPKNATFYFARSRLLWSSGELLKAIEDCGQAIQLDPKNAEFRRRRGRIYASRREFQLAIKDLSEGIELSSEDRRLYRDRANLWLQMHEWEDALRDVNRVLSLDPTDADAWVIRGEMRAQEGRLEEAQADFDKALNLYDTHQRALKGRASLAIRRADYRSALKDLDDAIQFSSKAERIELLRYRAKCHFELGDAVASLDDLQQAINLSPNSVESRLARAYILSEQKQFDRALADVRDALTLQPKSRAALRTKASIYVRQEDYQSAIESMRELINSGDTSPESQTTLAEILLETDQITEAVAELERVIKLNPTFHRAHYRLAWTYATHPDAKYRSAALALEHGRVACELTKWKGSFYLSAYAAALAESGNYKKAVEWQQKALAQCADDDRKDCEAMLMQFRAGKSYRDKRSDK